MTLAQPVRYFLLRESGEIATFTDSHAGYHHSSEQHMAARMGVLPTASLTEMRRLGVWSFTWFDIDLAVGVLLDRRPPWLGSWAAWMLTGRPFMSPWPMVHALVVAGAIERPPGYVEGMLIASRNEDWSPARLRALDPSLFSREVWELLDV